MLHADSTGVSLEVEPSPSPEKMGFAYIAVVSCLDQNLEPGQRKQHGNSVRQKGLPMFLVAAEQREVGMSHACIIKCGQKVSW